VLQPGTAKPTHAVPDRRTAEAVTGAADDLRLDRNAGRPQRIGKQLALVERHQGSRSPCMMRKGGSSALTQVRGWARRTFVRVFLNGAGDEKGPGRIRYVGVHRTGETVHLEEAGGTEPVAKGRHPAGDAGGFTSIEFRHVVRGAEQGGQVPAGRGGPDAESAGDKTVLARLGTQPAHGGFDVLQSGGEGGVLTEPVVRGGDGQTVGQQESGRAGCLRAAVPIPAGAGAPCKWLLTGWCDLLVCGACLAKVFA